MSSPENAAVWPRPAQGLAAAVRLRLPAAGLLLLCLAPLLLAARLDPAPAGVGTHRQLGLAACSLHRSTGLPCPTCGMTTTFALAVHGQPLRALLNQPAGFVLALGIAALGLVAAWALLSGMSLAPLGRWLARPAVWGGFAAVFCVSWFYKLALVVL